MGFFKRKIRVTPKAFIANEAQKSVSQKPSNLKEIFSLSNTNILNELELSIFAAFIPLLAMTLARLEENILRGYVALVSDNLDKDFGNNAGVHFQERTLMYLAAFDKDTAEGKAHLAPHMITIALNNLAGKSDESVVICRMGLIKFLLPTLKIDINYFKELKFV